MSGGQLVPITAKLREERKKVEIRGFDWVPQRELLRFTFYRWKRDKQQDQGNGQYQACTWHDFNSVQEKKRKDFIYLEYIFRPKINLEKPR